MKNKNVFLLTRNGSLKSIKMEDGSVPTKNGSLKIKMEDGSVPTKNGSLKSIKMEENVRANC
jgi:hypothetical protein